MTEGNRHLEYAFGRKMDIKGTILAYEVAGLETKDIRPPRPYSHHWQTYG